MSTDVLADILNLLRNHQNISFKVCFKAVKSGTNLTTISFQESTGVQSNHISSRNSSKKPEVKKKKVRKSPSRLLRDGKRQEAFLSRKSGAADLSPAEDPAPSTTDRMVSRRLAKPARRLGIVDAGFEAEWGSWGPGEELSVIPQLDGKADTREEEDAEEREKEDEMVLRDEKDESDEKDEDEKVKNALESLNMILANHLVFIKPD